MPNTAGCVRGEVWDQSLPRHTTKHLMHPQLYTVAPKLPGDGYNYFEEGVVSRLDRGDRRRTTGRSEGKSGNASTEKHKRFLLSVGS